jgi:hypothetical protein
MTSKSNELLKLAYDAFLNINDEPNNADEVCSVMGKIKKHLELSNLAAYEDRCLMEAKLDEIVNGFFNERTWLRCGNNEHYFREGVKRGLNYDKVKDEKSNLISK